MMGCVSHFKFTDTNINGLKVVTPFYVKDDRGIFRKPFEIENFLKEKINFSVCEWDENVSDKGVLRGLHMQHTKLQDKLVRVVSGSVFDVAVDMRKDSRTFGKWHGEFLTAENMKMFYIPRGFLHGLLVLEDKTVFSYLCGEKYYKQYDGGVIWNDEKIYVKWPLDLVGGQVILSEKDETLPCFDEFMQIKGINDFTKD